MKPSIILCAALLASCGGSGGNSGRYGECTDAIEDMTQLYGDIDNDTDPSIGDGNYFAAYYYANRGKWFEYRWGVSHDGCEQTSFDI